MTLELKVEVLREELEALKSIQVTSPEQRDKLTAIQFHLEVLEELTK